VKGNNTVGYSMKKYALVIAVIMIGAMPFTACKKNNAPSHASAIEEFEDDYGTLAPGFELQYNQETETDASVEIESPIIQIGHANSMYLENYDVSNIFYDNGNTGLWIALTTNTALKDFNFISVDYDYEADSWVAEILYSIAEFKPLMAFQVNTSIGDGMPSRGISYTDGIKKKHFYIYEGEYDGTILLTEFFLQEETFNEHLQKKMTITGIPASLNGLHCSISLTVFGENEWYEYIAWSEPALVTNGSATNIFFAYYQSEHSKDPFSKNGIFNVLVSINELNDQDLPQWQGNVYHFYFYGETVSIPWSDFVEVFG